MAATTKLRSKSLNSEDNINDEEEVTMGSEEFHVMRLEPRPFRPFKTSEEYLYAMKEDLAEWLKTLYYIEITVDNFFEQLETGVILCQHANNIVKMAREFKCQQRKLEVDIPDREVGFRHDVLPGTFPARDNVSNFISWCRCLRIKECLLFETEDLVTRKNERSVILCLLEVARYGARFGMLAPILVQIEQEIDAEIENPVDEDGTGCEDYMSTSTIAFQTHEQRMAQLMGLHERVVNLLNRCTCPSQFPMIKVADGKYRIGDRLIIFVRILRNHVMVRVGGGWDTLEHYLDKHDPCRCRSGHRFSTSAKLTMMPDKTGSPHMQVTYNRPAAVSDPPQPSAGLISHYMMENTVEKDCSSYPAKNHAPPASIYSSLPKSKSRSFDTPVADTAEHVGPKRYSLSPKGTKKENSDPSTFMSTNQSQSPNRQQSVEPSSPIPGHKLPLVPSCPNRIPIQRSASKSKIPCLESTVQNGHKISSKSQSTEDLYSRKYCNGADDRWQQRSRSSNSSPVHGTPRSTSMEQCSLAAVGARPVYSRRSEDFSYSRPGQYSFRHTRQSPELRRRGDQGNKTWAHHTRGQRPPLHSEWVSPSSSNTRIPSPRLQSTQVNRSSPKTRPNVSASDDDLDSSQALLKNVELCISRVEGQIKDHPEGMNGHGSPSPTNHDGKIPRSRPLKDGIAGSVSRIPIPQRHKYEPDGMFPHKFICSGQTQELLHDCLKLIHLEISWVYFLLFFISVFLFVYVP